MLQNRNYRYFVTFNETFTCLIVHRTRRRFQILIQWRKLLSEEIAVTQTIFVYKMILGKFFFFHHPVEGPNKEHGFFQKIPLTITSSNKPSKPTTTLRFVMVEKHTGLGFLG